MDIEVEIGNNYSAKSLLKYEIDGVPLEVCLSYGFLAPLTEDSTFARNYFKTCRDVLRSIKRILTPSHKQKLFDFTPNPVWLITLRPRSFRYWEHVIPELEELGLDPQVITPQILLKSLTRFERLRVCLRLPILLYKWKKLVKMFKEHPDMLNRMRPAWFGRGLDAICYIKAYTKQIKYNEPKMILIQDPTEISIAAEWAAGQHNFKLKKDKHECIENHTNYIETFCYQPFDDGMSVTRRIWENSMPGNVVAVANPRQRYRGFVVGDTSFALEDPMPDYLFTLFSRHVGPRFSIEEKEKYFKAVFKVAKRFNYQVAVKCHPYEKVSQTKREMKSWGLESKIYPDKEISARDILAFSKIAFNIPISGSVMDAFSSRVPVVIFGEEVYSPEKLLTSYADAVLYAKNENDCVRVIDKLLHDPRLRVNQLRKGVEFWEYFNGPCDGLAAKRLAELVKRRLDVFSAT